MTLAHRTKRTAGHVAYLVGVTFAAIVGAVVLVALLSLAINGIARWNAVRVAQNRSPADARLEKARDNLLIVGVDENDRAAGFLALRVDGEEGYIYGIAIPDGAFIEVPGQGFERIGDSWQAGPDVSLDAVANFFGVPFAKFVKVDFAVYQTALTEQSLVTIDEAIETSNLDADDRQRFVTAFQETPSDNVALVPMPVKPITLGSQTYFEPQRAEISDLVEMWWGVKLDAEETPTRVIVYNGSGVPGIAGIAAQQLIRGGLRVVDTKNADRFDYATTKVIVQQGPASVGDDIVQVIGVGEIVEQAADQQVADVIVIIGKDYQPPAR